MELDSMALYPCAKCEGPIATTRVRVKVRIQASDQNDDEPFKKTTDYCSYACAVAGMTPAEELCTSKWPVGPILCELPAGHDRNHRSYTEYFSWVG